MNTKLSHGLAAPATIALFAALALLPAVQAAPDGDLSRTFYRQEVAFIEAKAPGIGFHAPNGSLCYIGYTAGQIPQPSYYDNLRIYLNLKAGALAIPGPGAIGPAIPCPAPLVIGTLDPNGYKLVISALNVYATLDHIHLNAGIGAQRPSTETDVATSGEWDIGACRVADTKFSFVVDTNGFDVLGVLQPTILIGSRNAQCGAANNAWIAVREADSKMDTFISGDLQTDEVVAVSTGNVYVISCLTNNISWINTSPPSTGTRVANSHDYALLLDPTVAATTIVGDVAAHLLGTGPAGQPWLIPGAYDLGGDNGNICDATGAPADSALLVKVKPT
jgi:hypothetical protein